MSLERVRREEGPENARDFLEKLRSREAIAADSRVAVVVAHPDDESIGFGAQLQRFPGCLTVHVTDGAPNDWREWRGMTKARYAAVREREKNAALDLAGQTGLRESLGVTDQEVAFRLADTARRLVELFKKNKTRFVLTHAYEGGHPDHDGVAFAVHAAKKLMEKEGLTLEIIEAPYYRVKKGKRKLAVQTFAPADGTEIFTFRLNKEERALKRRLYAAHTSQARILSDMSTTRENMREAPEYDFRRLPNDGDISSMYDQSGLDGTRWTDLAAEALSELGLADQPAP